MALLRKIPSPRKEQVLKIKLTKKSCQDLCRLIFKSDKVEPGPWKVNEQAFNTAQVCKILYTVRDLEN